MVILSDGTVFKTPTFDGSEYRYIQPLESEERCKIPTQDPRGRVALRKLFGIVCFCLQCEMEAIAEKASQD